MCSDLRYIYIHSRWRTIYISHIASRQPCETFEEGSLLIDLIVYADSAFDPTGLILILITLNRISHRPWKNLVILIGFTTWWSLWILNFSSQNHLCTVSPVKLKLLIVVETLKDLIQSDFQTICIFFLFVFIIFIYIYIYISVMIMEYMPWIRSK